MAAHYGVSVHAYCLMMNHIHVLATPAEKTSISNTMKVVSSRYAQYINKKYKRTGTLWEGRHRSSLGELGVVDQIWKKRKWLKFNPSVPFNSIIQFQMLKA